MHTASPTQTLNYLPVPDVYEYKLVAQPNQAVTNKILQERQNFNNKYNQGTAIELQPTITVANFTALEAMEETIIRYMYRVYTNTQSFNVSLNNYGGYPPNILYLRVLDHNPLQQVSTSLKVINSYLQANGCSPVHYINTPHLTIAQNLSEVIYTKVLMDYSQKTFHETFLVTELVLLRKHRNDDQCKKISVFRLQPCVNDLYN